MRVALVGRPGSGKTTLWRALGGVEGGAPAAAIVSVEVPDPRLEWLRDLHEPKKFTPARIEFLDLPGIPEKDERGKGERLAAARESGALVAVVRAFADPSYPYERPDPDPLGEARSLREELRLGDYAILHGRIERIEASLRKPAGRRETDEQELATLRRWVEVLEGEGRDLRDLEMSRDDLALARSFGFASRKPVLLVVNAAEGAAVPDPEALRAVFGRALVLDAKVEEEIARLSPGEREAFLRDFGIEEPARARLVREAYAALGLISFFTVGEDEVRAWTIPQGGTALEAAGTIHTDLARGFIRAEVTPFDDLRAAGSWREARARSATRLEGKDYVVRDGEVVHIRFSV